MWLATIPVSRVKPQRREKLVLFQKEVCQVLAAHFLGKTSVVPSAQVPTLRREDIAELFEKAISRVMEPLTKKLSCVEEKLERLGPIEEKLNQVKAREKVTSDNLSLVHGLQHQLADIVAFLAEDLSAQYEKYASKKKRS